MMWDLGFLDIILPFRLLQMAPPPAPPFSSLKVFINVANSITGWAFLAAMMVTLITYVCLSLRIGYWFEGKRREEISLTLLNSEEFIRKVIVQPVAPLLIFATVVHIALWIFLKFSIHTFYDSIPAVFIFLDCWILLLFVLSTILCGRIQCGGIKCLNPINYRLASVSLGFAFIILPFGMYFFTFFALRSVTLFEWDRIGADVYLFCATIQCGVLLNLILRSFRKLTIEVIPTSPENKPRTLSPFPPLVRNSGTSYSCPATMPDPRRRVRRTRNNRRSNG